MKAPAKMIQAGRLKHEFVKEMPSEIEEGVVYVSIEYATAVHKCCCGCGLEVVTPFTPTDWKLIFDGESISLTPSIGNWSFPCRSHYWVKNDKIKWAGDWSDKEVEAGRHLDKAVKEEYFKAVEPNDEGTLGHGEESVGQTKFHPWYLLKQWLLRRRKE